MLRLLQLTDKAEGGGGIRRVVEGHRRLLAERGWTVDGVRFSPYGAAAGAAEPVLRLGLAPGPSELEALGRWAAAADAVHLHLGFASLPPEAVEVLARAAPLVVSLHDVSPFEGLGRLDLGRDLREGRTTLRDSLARWRLRRLRRSTWAALCARSRTVLAPSRYLADLATAAGVPRERIRVLPHAVDPVAPLSEPPSACPPVVAFAGLLSPGKGVPLLLDAIASLRTPGARLELLGEGPSGPALRRRAEALGLDGRVRFHGSVEPGRVAAAFGEARVVAHPSLVPEGFGLVGVEALQQGRPVVGFGTGGASDWLRPEETGLRVEPADPVAFGRALDRLLGDGALADRLGEAGRELVQRRFSAERVGDDLDDALRRAVRAPRPEAAA